MNKLIIDENVLKSLVVKYVSETYGLTITEADVQNKLSWHFEEAEFAGVEVNLPDQPVQPVASVLDRTWSNKACRDIAFRLEQIGRRMKDEMTKADEFLASVRPK